MNKLELIKALKDAIVFGNEVGDDYELDQVVRNNIDEITNALVEVHNMHVAMGECNYRSSEMVKEPNDKQDKSNQT